MSNIAELLERESRTVDLEPGDFERLTRRRDRRQRNRRIASAVVALLVVGATIGGLLRAFSSHTVPADDPRVPFLGTWVATDVDGSTSTMVIQASGDEDVEIEGHDDFASVCSGAPSTMTGTGQVLSATGLVVPSPALTCDDGSEPHELSGPPLEEQLRNLTFVDHPETKTLTDNFGVVWERVRRDNPSPEPATPGMWPQSSLEEVRQAQELADAGDPRYTWQVDPELAMVLAETWDVEALPGDAEIFARFLREELGWEEFRGGAAVVPPDEAGVSEAGSETFEYDVVFVRCAPGRTNPLYPNDPEGRGCAPTIDEFHYETVNIRVGQLVRHGRSGIWVVTGSQMLPPIELVVPPSDAETTALLQGFLQARVGGEGAQEFLRSPEDDWEIPLLYATTSGAPYERSEFELLDGPRWPSGWMDFRVRLFAQDGKTVVEQCISLKRDDTGRLGLLYACQAEGPEGLVLGTTENGRVIDSYSFLDGEVTLFASPPWRGIDFFGPWRLYRVDNLDGNVLLLADPRPVETGCRGGPASADADALARSIRSDPDLEATEPVVVSVGGIEALRMDVVATPGASVCQNWEGAGVVTDTGAEESDPLVVGGGYRMRLYLLDLPEGLSVRILAIAIVAPESSFERVVEAAQPILDSFEFHTR
jgi:hypothetical protein